MKIKNIAAICKKNKYAVIYERYTEGGGVVQYIGDGAAAYPVTGLPAEYCFFTGDGRRNHFTTEWKSTDCFGWTLENPYTN